MSCTLMGAGGRGLGHPGSGVVDVATMRDGVSERGMGWHSTRPNLDVMRPPRVIDEQFASQRKGVLGARGQIVETHGGHHQA